MIIKFSFPEERTSHDPNLTAEIKCLNCGMPFVEPSSAEEPVIRWDHCWGTDASIYLHPECALEMINGMTRDVLEAAAIADVRKKQAAATAALHDAVKSLTKP